ncbi:murein biosynthesis integral membrane protein MurJ [Mycobacterium sp. CVI_P3]|uniref:Murein biosynthesis integral membrane protein MurJ n=1 Tax=Mycobacterium pinniadriaticum TaxID=2994102 RepID=A0ABT3SA43_9MYCO|nr:murein biosynthesis integral membrane protein MurJ [Mycobacterium pinniadriaticum]MCX2929298.1 murein biosynthesis integral membrane protein MurJ [Mycobacterium pinniadriaticum]MCX2935722.1 murein biosynthesis integral membrane protein MurJ [Mycobacterium pinniadriaticum]
MKPPAGRSAGDVRPGTRAGAVRTELSDAAVVSRSWGMALATLVSRVTGFIRIVLLAAILGAALSSAFTVANQLPNLIAALVLEATFTAIFVPVLARAERDDPDGGEAFVRRLVTLATTLLMVATVLSVAAAPLLVRLMLGRDPQVNQPLTTAFAYLLLPQVIFYGLSSVFMAILNNRNVFGPPAWAPVVNNVVAIATLGLYLIVPGPLSVDPVHMGNAKLLVLGVGTTLGVVAQTVVLLLAIRVERISLRPLWGIDDRLKRFGTMAGAMVLYVLISQVGLVVGNQIASTAAASGPAIYNYTWLVLMLPFGIIGVTVLTVVMPRLSRNAAADNTPAVLADLSLATRLTMVTLIPIVALMTVGGPAMGSALFAYGRFGEVDANYLGMAISLSAFTLIPYALVLLQLRVFYAREQPWTPILIIVAIITVKIAASLLAPHLTGDPELVAGYLGLANGIGFLAGAVLGYVLLNRALKPPHGKLLDLEVLRSILVTTAASLLAGLIAHVVDRLLGLQTLTDRAGGVGSLLRLLVLSLIMLPILAAVMLAARVPDAVAAWGAVKGRILRTPPGPPSGLPALDRAQVPTPVTYPEHSNSPRAGRRPQRYAPPTDGSAVTTGKGPEVNDQPSGMPPSDSTGDATTKIPRQAADDFQPDVPGEVRVDTVSPQTDSSEAPRAEEASPAAPPTPDFAGDPSREPLAFDPPREPAMEPAAETGDDDTPLMPGASIAGGRYRLLVFHGGPPGLQFWQALDTALDRQVALTFVDPDGTMPDGYVQEILSRTLKLSRVERTGIARVLDVTNTGAGGLVVSEWIRGGSLKEVADTSPSPIGGARAVQSLAAAAEAAHTAGVALSIDHPSRVRVSIEGDVALAFPATMPGATPEDDIRGIGAALYALLVDRWPLPEKGAPSGMQPAETDPAGEPLEPRAVDRAIPFQISAAAARSVQAGGGIRSAPTLLNLLQQATAVADRTDLIEPVEPTGSASPRPAAEADPEAQARRRRNLLIGVGVGAAILVVALIVLASVLSSIFGDVGGGLKGDQLGLNPSTSQSEGESAPSGSTVTPVKATVFSPEGGADNPDKADLALTGGPGNGWATDTYTDPDPFPNFKNGVGLLLQLPQPTTVGSVSLTVPSTGTQVQIRSASSADPASLEDTTALTQPTTLQPGANTIQVDAKSPTTYLVVWISTMGTTDGKNKTEISGLTVKAAS